MVEDVPCPEQFPMVEDVPSPEQVPMTKLRMASFEFPPRPHYGDSDGTEWCAWMVKNLPSRVTREELLSAIDGLGFEGQYGFFYMPTKKTARGASSSKGYAFIGFADVEVANRFHAAMTGFRFPNRMSAKVVELAPARLQTLQDMENHFEGKAVTSSAFAPKMFAIPQVPLPRMGAQSSMIWHL